MQAIVTRFLAPTNHRGARIKATAQAGALTVPWDYALGVEENHRAAALAFATRWGWPVEGAMMGALPNEDYVLVFPPRL